MSEYQYYEFQAIDQPLSDEDRKILRSVSSRARITATSFVNEYNWGDFKGNTDEFMKRWFDLHLYFANWGTRRLMIRLPKKLVERSKLDPFLRGWGILEVADAGNNLVLDFHHDDEGGYYDYDEWDDASVLGGMAKLRSDIISGDWRGLYVAWLWTVDQGDLRDEEKEPLPGIGPLNASLKALANFLRIDRDLLSAAAEESAGFAGDISSRDTIRSAIADLSNFEKTNLLCRLAEGDPHVALEVRKRVSDAALASASERVSLRTAADLRARAKEVRAARKIAEKREQEVEREQRRIAAEKARRQRLDFVWSKGEAAWREIDDQVKTPSGRSYDVAAQLVFDLKTLADEHGTTKEFFERLDAVRQKHARKGKFIERLEKLRR